MSLFPLVPDVALLRVLTAGGPYAPGDLLTLAFNDAAVGRLIGHPALRLDDALCATEPIVPESIGLEVALAAGPYERGERLTLSFVDPRFARILRAAPAEPLGIGADAAPLGVRVELGWEADRTQRFVGLVDTLFTIEGLGCYRHLLAVRLLVADTIATGAAADDIVANQHLRTLRNALAQALGRPLLDACIPGFAVTRDWLDERDELRAAQALAALRTTLAAHADDCDVQAAEALPRRTVGRVTRRALAAMTEGALDAMLPALIPCTSTVPAVTAALGAYRAALAHAFERFAGVPDAGRIEAMTQPDHALDDRLWQLAGAVGESFGGLAVA